MKKLWHNWGDESIYGKILKCSQSCGADGILSFRGREENELFCVLLLRTMVRLKSSFDDIILYVLTP